jgi:hypothetical protein
VVGVASESDDDEEEDEDDDDAGEEEGMQTPMGRQTPTELDFGVDNDEEDADEKAAAACLRAINAPSSSIFMRLRCAAKASTLEQPHASAANASHVDASGSSDDDEDDDDDDDDEMNERADSEEDDWRRAPAPFASFAPRPCLERLDVFVFLDFFLLLLSSD